jgi:hypothetical protein
MTEPPRGFKLIDFAYACFAAFGMALLALWAGPALGVPAETIGTIGMLTGMGFLLALFCGIALAVWYWRHTSLLLLGLINIAFWAIAFRVLFFSDPLNPSLYFQILIGIYVATLILIPAWWFAVGRRHTIHRAAHPAI